MIWFGSPGSNVTSATAALLSACWSKPIVTESSTSAWACCVWTDSTVASISPPCGGNCRVSASVTVPVSGVVTDTANALPLKVVALSAKAGVTEDAAKSAIIETVRIAKATFDVLILGRCLSFNVFPEASMT